MVRIITDSAADFEPADLEAMNIFCIPITVILEGQEYQENVNLSKNQFYDLLASTGGAPKTAQPSPVLLRQLLKQAKQAGDEAVYITLSSALSGTYQSAVMTTEDMDCDGFYIVDSRNATGRQRLLVEYAVRLRDAGHSAAEIARAVEALRETIVLYACIDTLEYLYRGGRISHTVYKIGSLAQVKPLIHVSPRVPSRCPPRPWVCARAWIFWPSGWSCAVPARSIPCTSCTPPTVPTAKCWRRSWRSWAIPSPQNTSST